MKKVYENPELRVVRVALEDVIATSIGLKLGGIQNDERPISVNKDFTTI